MRLSALDLRSLEGSRLRAYHALYNAIRAERTPAEQPLSLDKTAELWRTVPSFVEVRCWGAWESDQLVGAGAALLSRYAQNRHMVVSDIMVRPDARRRGFGTALLARIAETSLHEGRSVIQGASRVPDGHRFAAAMGARVGMHSVTNELHVPDTHVSGLERWVASGPTGNRFTLRTLRGPCPEDLLERVAKAWHLLNDAPTDDLSYDNDLLTPEQLREFDQRRESAGIDQITMILDDELTPDAAGFAHLTHQTGASQVIHQDGLAIARHVRGAGLARWLEANALLAALSLWPDATSVRTDQAKSNTATLAVFHKFGFAQVQEFVEWEADLATLVRRLHRTTADPDVRRM